MWSTVSVLFGNGWASACGVTSRLSPSTVAARRYPLGNSLVNELRTSMLCRKLISSALIGQWTVVRWVRRAAKGIAFARTSGSPSMTYPCLLVESRVSRVEG
eukprot:9968713-Alexandrium_andersonii.AAC.1